MGTPNPHRVARNVTPFPPFELDAMYAALVDSADDAIFVKTLEGVVVSWNPGAERLYGYSAAEMIGRPVTDLAFPDEAAQIMDFLAVVAAGQRIEHMETVRRHRDGTRLDVSLTISPIRNREGQIVAASTIARDIRERIAQQAQISSVERRFRGVIDSSPNAWVGVDPQGIVIYANDRVRQTFGYPPDEIVGEPVEVLVPERFRGRHVLDRTNYYLDPAPRAAGTGRELAGLRKDGSEFPVEISLSGLTDSDLVFASIVDITVRKTLEAQLLQAQKLESIGRLAGGIAHDFNNMLFAIRGFAEMLDEDLDPDSTRPFDRAEAHHSVKAIATAADRASDLTGQLLAFSRQQAVNPTVLDVNETVRAIEPMLRRLIGANIGLTTVLDPATGNVRADAGQFGQIFINLVVNARDAMPDGGSISIQTANATFDEPYAIAHVEVAPGAYVVLIVSDSGSGMDRETRDHAFEPFFTTKEVGKGTGLGLATIYGIVRQAGGHIWLYSEPGHGSTFKLYFPRVDGDSVPVEPRPGPSTTRGVGTVLVVEDEPAVREMTTLVLERGGYRVQSVGNAQDAIRILDGGEPIDVLLTDVIMPGMSGIELAERTMSRQPTVGIVLVSGYLPETLDLDRLIRRGVIFAAKPATAAITVEAVARALASRQGSADPSG